FAGRAPPLAAPRSPLAARSPPPAARPQRPRLLAPGLGLAQRSRTMRRSISVWARAVAAGTTFATVALFLLVLPAAHVCAQSQPRRDDPRETPKVRRLVLRGVDHADVRDLEKSISTQRSLCKNLLLEMFC